MTSVSLVCPDFRENVFMAQLLRSSIFYAVSVLKKQKNETPAHSVETNAELAPQLTKLIDEPKKAAASAERSRIAPRCSRYARPV
jgi:hypothetical protein